MPAARRLVPLLLAAGLFVAACSNDITPTPEGGPVFTIVFTAPQGTRDMRSLVQAGGYVYASFRTVEGGAGGALTVYRIPGTASLDTVALTPVDTLALDSGGGGIAAKGDVLYVGMQSGTVALDLADPARPAVIDSVFLPPGANTVRVDGNRLLLCDGNALSLWDVSAPAAPVRTHASAVAAWVGDILGDRLAVGERDAQRVSVFDVSRPDTFTAYPGAVASTAPGYPAQVRLNGDFLYVLVDDAATESGNRVDTWDLASLDTDSTMTLVDSDPVSWGPAVLETAGDLVMAADAGLVHVFRIAADGTLAEELAVASTVGPAGGEPATGTLTSRTAIVPGYDVGLMFGF